MKCCKCGKESDDVHYDYAVGVSPEVYVKVKDQYGMIPVCNSCCHEY